MISVIAALILGAAPAMGLNDPVANAVPPSQPAIAIPVDSASLDSIQEEERITSILKEGERLEQLCRWRNALELYETAIRRYPSSKRLQAQFSRLKILCDIQKRFATPAHARIVSKMGSQELEYFVEDFFRIHQERYVQPMTPSEIFYREVRCMEIALGNVTFCEQVLPGWKKADVDAFRGEIREIPRQSVIRSQQDLVRATLAIGERFQNRFQKNSAFLVLEGLFDFVVSLDAYSEVLLPSQYQDLLASVSGNMVGVGIEFRTTDGVTRIVNLISRSPAAQSSLRKEDLILAIDGESIQNWSIEQVSEKMNGEADTDVRLRVQTENQLPRDVVLRRRALTISSIDHCMILPDSDGVAYVRLTSFQRNSSLEMNQALQRLSRQGMRSLIIDLRGNPGGAMNAAIEMADLFLQDGGIVLTQDYANQTLHQAHEANTWDVPLILLINEKSASASEIFAGAIHDRNRGKLVGTRSFGKGAIQSMFEITGSPFVLKLTTAQFFSPSGKRYNYVGVTPDYVVHQNGKLFFEEIEELRQPAPLPTSSNETRDAVLVTAMGILTSKR